MVLIEARGAVVGKDALMARVWPNRIVEENNLQSQTSALRAAFAAERDLIRTVFGRGYKTRLALAAARRLLPHFAEGAWVAEFSPFSDPGLVPATLAAVGLELGGGDASAQRVAHALADRPLLLVLDTCEHVTDVAADMAEAVLRAGSAEQVIATSRETLRVEGEWAYPVPPLDVPAEDAVVGDDPLRYCATRLFIERARAARPHFALERSSAAMMGRSAGCSTASRWRSSWRRRVPLCSELRRSPPASMISSAC